MGISGLLAQIGHGQRISLAKLSAEYYTKNDRPLRLAIDISIWLFQIQSGKGGSNPALRTFYYRLLRLLSLNIHPLFVFDGPNKPLFKRNKKVGGPGVKVASVPEFLAKQLLKQFGFPLHVAPGEAEAECALLQREGIVDAVLSEDVDTLMFGSGVTLRTWTAENSQKTPTHVDVHRAEETKTTSGMDREGMILVALMSGGDYLPEGIPGCGPKVACDAARAGFGEELCALGRKDAAGLEAWKERLRHEIRTNESKFFKRKNPSLVIPDDFPSRAVLGFYTHPCVSNVDKLARLRQELTWDQPMDFAALRSFASDAFDWRCIGGAKKFIKNFAPALLIRELRLCSTGGTQAELEAQEEKEHELILAIHGKRNHSTTDGELEYRISFVPEKLVPIDLSIEDEDDEFLAAGGLEDASDAESDFMQLPSSTQDGDEADVPASPKKRNFKPYNPSQPEKLWIQRPFLQVGCPLLVEEYESTSKDPKEFLKQRRQARAVGKGNTNIHSTKPKPKKSKARDAEPPPNTMLNYARVSKPVSSGQLKESSQNLNTKPSSQATVQQCLDDEDFATVAGFKLPSTQIPAELLRDKRNSPRMSETIEVLDLAMSSPATTRKRAPPRPTVQRPPVSLGGPSSRPESRAEARSQSSKADHQRTPRRENKKRPSPDLSSPALSQRTIFSYYSPTPRKFKDITAEPIVVDLLSSPSVSRNISGPYHDVVERQRRPLTPTPPNIRSQFVRTSNVPPPAELAYSPGKLPDTVTKRRKKSALKRWQTEPTFGHADDGDGLFVSPGCERILTPPPPADDVYSSGLGGFEEPIEVGDRSPASSEHDLASPSTFVRRRHSNDEAGGFIHDEEDMDATPKPIERVYARRVSALLQEVVDKQIHTSSLSAPLSVPELEDELPSHPITTAITAMKPPRTKPTRKAPSAAHPAHTQLAASQPVRKSPRHHVLKKRIHLRESLEGSWKVTETEAIDMTGDGSGWEQSNGKAKLAGGWRKSGVEVLDLTCA